MRTLHVIPSLAARTGGPAVNVASLSSGLVAAGERATVYTTDLGRAVSARGHAPVDAASLVPIDDRVAVRIFESRPPRRFAYAPGLGRFMHRVIDDFDLVHVHSLFLYPQAVAMHVARSRRVPYVVSPRGSLDPWVRAQGRLQKAAANTLWQTRLLASAAAIHVAGSGEEAYIADVAPDVPRLVLPNGVHVEDFAPVSGKHEDRMRAKFEVPAGAVLVLFVGRLSRKKNLDALIEGFAPLTRSDPPAVLVIAGPDDENLEHQLKKRALALGVAESVKFVGELRGADRRGAYAAADIFILPSHTENFGVAAVEALASGCAVVVSDGVAIAEELSESGAALVTAPTAAGITAGLASVIRDEALRTRLGDAGRRAAGNYDWARLIPRYLDAYRAVVRGATA